MAGYFLVRSCPHPLVAGMATNGGVEALQCPLPSSAIFGSPRFGSVQSVKRLWECATRGHQLLHGAGLNSAFSTHMEACTR